MMDDLMVSSGGMQFFIRRLDSLSRLSSIDIDAIVAAVSTTRIVPAQMDLVREGDIATHIHILVDGIACRYKLVEGGRRQIVSFLVPGDICDAHGLMTGAIDHSVLSLSETKVALISREAVRAMLDTHPRITRALLFLTLVDESRSREWLANMGRRSPDKRIAHLLCEMLTRLRTVGLADNNRFGFPVTQADLGDTMGLSTVHVNRTLQDLKEKKLIAARRGFFEVLDLTRLHNFCDFNPAYLMTEHARITSENGR